MNKLKKYITILFILLSVIILISGCGMKQLEIKISSNIEKYHPAMSSVPGYPLTVTFENEKKAYKIHWQTEAGNFVFWDAASGKVEEKGNDIETDRASVYWSPISQGAITNRDVEIKVEILDEGNNVIGKAKVVLSIDDQGYVQIKR